MNPYNLPEEMHLLNCAGSGFIAANEDIFAGDPATDVISLENWFGIVFFILKNAGATGTATVTVESCDDVTPTTPTAVAFRLKVMTTIDTYVAWAATAAAGTATTAGANQTYLAWVNADELSGSDKFVRMQLTEVVNNPVDGAVGCMLFGPRYAEDVPATVLA